LKYTPTGIHPLEDNEAVSSAACPFHPASTIEWDVEGVRSLARGIAIKSGMHHLSLQLQVESPNFPKFKFKEPQLLIGFVLSGWAKVSVPDHGIEKLEPGYYFILESTELRIDRTSEESVHMNLFTCSQTFAQSLLDLGLVKNNSTLERFASSKLTTQSRFQCHPMRSSTFELAQQLTHTDLNELKHRLTLEANALLWIADVLKDDQTQSAQTTTLNADDRDAIEKIIKHMHETPGYEYSLTELCNIGGINEHKLKAAFKAIHGQTAFTYLRNVRMKHASQLLKQDRYSVIQVANEVGYSNASHFARAFKEHHGLLPKAFQCLHRR
jgi:AraC-like DNA-binding protein